MNFVLVTFALFILGLQDFNGNNGIAATPEDDARKFGNLRNAVDDIINIAKGSDIDYVSNVTSVDGLQNAIKNNFPKVVPNDRLTQINTKLNTAINTKDYVNREDALSVKGTIEELTKKK